MSWKKDVAWSSTGASYTGGVGAYYSSNSYTVSADILTRRVLAYRYSGATLETAISSTAVISKLSIYIRVGATDPAQSVTVGALATPITDTSAYQANYSRITAAPATWTLSTGTERAIEVTDAQQIKKIIANGIGINPVGSSWGTSSAWIYSSAEITYTDAEESPAVRTVTVPATHYLTDALNISWDYSQSADVAQTAVDVALFSTDGEVEEEKARLIDHKETSATSLTAPLDALTLSGAENMTFTVKVRAYAANGTVSAWSGTTATAFQFTRVTLTAPIGGVNVIATETIRLRWKKSAETPSVRDPVRFEIGLSANAGETWETTELSVSDTQRDGEGWYINVPADTLSAGVIRWRVMAWNTVNAVDLVNYPTSTFVAVINAETSSVTCDGKPMPTVSWSANAQAAYQAQLDSYDSGAVYGSANSHTVQRIFDDGLYPVRVRTQATTGVWSDWTEWTYVQITNDPPEGSITLSAEKTKNAVKLKWTCTTDLPWFILYRNGTPVYGGTDNSFLDIAGNGDCEYLVRGVLGKNFVQSANVNIDARPNSDVLYDVTNGEWIAMKRTSALRRRQSVRTPSVTFKQYAGRTFPVAFATSAQERQWTLSCCSTGRELGERIEALAGREVVYKTTSGVSVRGVIGAVTVLHELIYEISAGLTEIDAEDRVVWGEQSVEPDPEPAPEPTNISGHYSAVTLVTSSGYTSTLTLTGTYTLIDDALTILVDISADPVTDSGITSYSANVDGCSVSVQTNASGAITALTITAAAGNVPETVTIKIYRTSSDVTITLSGRVDDTEE